MVKSKGEVSASTLLTEGREVGVEANINNQSKIVNIIAYNFAPKKVYRFQLGQVSTKHSLLLLKLLALVLNSLRHPF